MSDPVSYEALPTVPTAPPPDNFTYRPTVDVENLDDNRANLKWTAYCGGLIVGLVLGIGLLIYLSSLPGRK